MLTIREPIALRIQRPIQTIRQDMAARMQANYGLMRLPIRKEELLHITSEPPEVYFAQGDQISISTQITHENQQELRLDVINNLINRIVVAQTENFTYQDTVYISSILRKLGIRDERLFMKQIFALQNETKESYQLLQKYEKNQEMLQMLFEQEPSLQKEEKKGEEAPAEGARRYYLHDDIFKRLETRKIYQDMRAYSRGILHASQQIYRSEISVGEQAALVQNFYLHELKQRITQTQLPLYYYHNNAYEFLQEVTEEINQTLEEQISAALLLNLTDQSYALRQQQITENSHYWYSVVGALFQTSENTWKRYEANLTEEKRVSQQMLQVLTMVNEAKRIEGNTIESIAEEYHLLHQEWQDSTEVRQLMVQQKQVFEGGREEISLAGGSYHLTQEELALTFLQQGEEPDEEAPPAAMTAQQLQQQLESFHQKNYENYQKITEIQQQQPRLKDRKLDRKKARQDALRALERPDEVLMEYLTTEIFDPAEEAKRQMETRLYALFSDETKEIYRQYLMQSHSAETNFLQSIMEQPEESEVRQEVMQAMAQVQREEIHQRTKQQVQEQTKLLQPMLSQTIHQELHQKLISLQEQQEIGYRSWILPTELYWQREKETETVQQQTKTLHEESVIRQEKMLQSMETELVERGKHAAAKQTLIHKTQEGDTEEIFLESQEKRDVSQLEQTLTQIRQNIEKKLQRQQQEHRAEFEETKNDLDFRQVHFVHKTEEQIFDEALLERLRLQQQKTKQEEHLEETTFQQNKITQKTVQETLHQVETSRMEHIEELIQQNVKNQLNHLSEQVYGKLEKKLQTERKRRGFS